MKSRLLLALSLVLLNTMCASAPPRTDSAQAGRSGQVAPAYTSNAGELAVGVIPAGVLNDSSRGRRLDLAIEYPIRTGSYPLVIFSTGFGIPNRSYVALSSYWASHGYVVFKVGHPDSKPGDAEVAEVWRGVTPEVSAQRARDISFVIDSVTLLEQQYPELAGKIDPARIAVAGHSVGALTAMLLAGTKIDSGGQMSSFADPRVRAAVVMSPIGPGQSHGINSESFRDVKIPVMYMTGTADRGVSEEENESWRRLPFELSPAGDKWFVSIAGAGHYSFAGRVAVPATTEPPDLPRVAVDPRDPRSLPPGTVDQGQTYPSRRVDRGFYSDRALMNVIRTVSLAFFDAYVGNEESGRTYLRGLSSRGDMTVASK
jgi:predicted dienelactone hydrolase